MQNLLTLDGRRAVTIRFDMLSLLAEAQNIALQPGEVRREVRSISSLFVSLPIRSTLTTRPAAWDAACKTAPIVRKRHVAPAALKRPTLALTRAFAAAAGKRLPPKAAARFGKIELGPNSQTIVDAKDGMVRRQQERSIMTAISFRRSFRKQASRLVTATRLAE